MAVFTIMSRRREYSVQISDKDVERVTNLAQFYNKKRVKDYRSDKRDREGYRLHVADYSTPSNSWHIVWQKEKIVTVATTVYVGPKYRTKHRHKTRQVKLHEYVVGDIPKCKAVCHRDGDPLNNNRENLKIHQAYATGEIQAVKTRGKSALLCEGCIDANVCRRVITGKKLTR